MDFNTKTFTLQRDSSLSAIDQFIDVAIGFDAYRITGIKAISVGPNLTHVTISFFTEKNSISYISPSNGSIFSYSNSPCIRAVFNTPIYSGIASGSIKINDNNVTGFYLSNNNFLLEINTSSYNSNDTYRYSIQNLLDQHSNNNFDKFIGGYTVNSLADASPGKEEKYQIKGRTRAGVIRNGSNPQQDIKSYFIVNNIREPHLICWDVDSYNNIYFIYITASEPSVIASIPQNNSTLPSTSISDSIVLKYNTRLNSQYITGQNLFYIYSGYQDYTIVSPSDISIDNTEIKIDIASYITSSGLYSLYVKEGVPSSYGIYSQSPYMYNLAIGTYAVNGGSVSAGGTGAPTDATYILHTADVDLPNALTLKYANAITGVVVGSNLTLSGIGINEHIANTSNPHSVTAAQVGAPTISQFTGHTGNTSIHFLQSDILIDSSQVSDFTGAASVAVLNRIFGASGITYNTDGSTSITLGLSGWLYTGITGHIGNTDIHFTQSQILISASQVSDFTEASQDAIGPYISGQSGINYTYDDAGNKFLVSLSGWLYTGITGHIGNSDIHFTVGSINHGSLANLTADDHTGYILANGSRNFTDEVLCEVAATDPAGLVRKNEMDTADNGLLATIVLHATDSSIHFTQASISIPSTQISDFTEASQDSVGSIISGLSGITTLYTDSTPSITVGLSGWLYTGITGHIGNSNIHFTQSQISIPSSQISDFTEATQDVIGSSSFLLYGEGVSGTYNDGANTLTLSGLIASTSRLGIASYSSNDFSVSAGGQATVINRLNINSGLRDLASPETGRIALRVRYGIDDFVGWSTSAAWTTSSANGGAVYSYDQQYSSVLRNKNNIGIISTDSTTATGSALLIHNQSTLWMRDDTSYYFNILMSYTGQAFYRVGLVNGTLASTGTPSNAVYFEYDSRSGITWYAMTASGGNYTRAATTITGSTAATTWLCIESVSTGYRFYEANNNNTRLAATITSTLPPITNAIGKAFCQATGLGGTYRALYIDKFMYPIYYASLPSGIS